MKIARKKLSQRLINFSLAMGFLAGGLVTNLTLPTAFAASPSDVWVTSAMPNPVSTDTVGEYIVLENQTASSVNLSGWKIDDGGASVGTLSGTIAASGTYKLCVNDATYADCDGEWTSMSLNDSGDSITLKQGTTVIDQVSYTSGQVSEGVAVAFSSHVAAHTVRNANTGETFATIQAAIDDTDTSDGHKIIADDGTYNENISINKNITLKSQNGAATTTIAPSAGRAIQLLGQHADMANVTIDGFTLEGVANQITIQANSQANDGYDYTDLVYKNLVINANGGFGLGLFDVDGITISNVAINDAKNGIEAVGLTGFKLNNSSVSNSTGVGINVFAAAGYEANDVLRITNTNFAGNATAAKFVAVTDARVTGGSVTGGAYGIVSDGSRTIVNGTNFSGIHPSVNTGIAVVGLGGTVPGGHGAGSHLPGKLTVKNSTFTNIGRIGVLAKGDDSQLTVTGSTYTGKGAINGLDYAVEFGAGATGSVTGSTISDNKAVASDGSTSAGILVTNYYGNGTQATITKNTFTGNTTAVAVGYNNTDTSKVMIKNNNITGNDEGISTSSALVDVNAKRNWWGDVTGPSGAASGTGDSVDSNATYSPWLCQPFQDGTHVSVAGVCDVTGPTAPVINTPTNEQYFSSSPIQATWGASTDASGVAGYQIAYNYDDGHVFGASTCPGISMAGYSGFIGCRDVSSTSRNHEPALSEQGGVTIWVRAVDTLGHYSEWSSPVHYYYDATAPAAPTLTSPVDGIVMKGASVTQSWNSTSTDVDYYVYESYNDAGSTDLRWDDTYTSTSKTANNVSDATYWWRVKAVDYAGNESGWSDLWKITIDNTAPNQVTGMRIIQNGVDRGTNPVVKDRNITVDWDDSDDANFDHFEYQADADKTTPYDFDDTVNTSERSGTIRDEDGTYNYRVRAVDAAGNVGPWSDWVSVTLDRQAPAVLMTPLSGAYGFINTININAEIEDAVSYKVLVDGVEVASGSAPFVTYALPVVDGTYTLQVKATDMAGNEGVSAISTLTIDNTAPAVTLVDVTVNGNVITPNITADDLNGPLTFTWTANDPQSATNVTISDDTVLNPDFTVNADGAYSFDVTVTDSLGNSHTETFSFTYTTPTPPSTGGNDGGDDTNTGGGDVNDGFTVVAFQPATPNQNEGDDEEVLGAQDQNDENANTGTGDEEVLGTDTSADKDSGWAPFGIMWYWWILILAAVGAFAWWLGRRFRQDESA